MGKERFFMTKAFSDLDMFDNSDINNDPMAAIFELNLGDFLTEHLISKDLAGKIKTSVEDKIPRLKNQLKELISIYSLNNTLSLLGFETDEDFVIYNSIAKTMKQMLDADMCHIYLTKENISTIESKNDLIMVGTSLEGIDLEKLHSFGFELSEKCVQTSAFLEQKSYYLKGEDAKKAKLYKELNEDKIQLMLCTPMSSNTGNVGVICIESNNAKDFSPEYIKLVEVTSRIFVTSMNLQKLIEQTQFLIDDEEVSPSELTHIRAELTAIIGDISDEQQMFVEALADAADKKGQHKEHCRKVAQTAREIARYLELNEKTNDLIYYAGLLQNIGKVALSEEIFTKKDKLSSDEWQKLRNHPNVGVSLLMNINFLSEVIPYIHYHKELWNGEGEPEGLVGNSIPFGSRIIAVADAYVALTSERPYRKALSPNETIEILKKEAGIKWDPIIVDAIEHLKEE